ncbi:hypothetical protein [Paludisphaera rhizosphaerae]|uniref:hypothetical protein n=1 Tax=Paludisphaera rhizosphaerae TaxID=2711216 RepID=UPI0013EDA655|nr:hypothetical protein [Paludisphaera rhizosphaerae]
MPAPLLLTAAALAFLAEPTSLAPISARSFHVAPDQPARLDWKPIGDGEPSLEYLVRDYTGAEEARGKAAVVDGVIRVERSFRQGYHEVEFPATSQRFGVLALPKAEGDPDPFFAMDAAMSWLVRDDQTRDELIAFARGVGLSMIRERMTWNAIQPAPDRWDWEAGSRFERLQHSYHAAGIPFWRWAMMLPDGLGESANTRRISSPRRTPGARSANAGAVTGEAWRSGTSPISASAVTCPAISTPPTPRPSPTVCVVLKRRRRSSAA